MASSAVHPLPVDDDRGGGDEDAFSGRITSPRVDHVLASSSSHVWPSVSDSDEEDGKGGGEGGSHVSDGGGDGLGRVTYPKVYNGGRKSGEEEEGEILELVDGVHGDGEVVEEKGSVVDDQVLQEVGSVLSAEEAEVLRGRLARSTAGVSSGVEGESSSGSVVNSSGRGYGGVYVTEDLPDDWLGVEEVSSSGAREGNQGSGGGESSLRDTGSKRVYTFPKREEDVVVRSSIPAVEEVGSQILASPVGIAIELVGFQIKLILQMFSIALWLCSFGVSVMTFPFRASLTATNVAVTTAVDGYALASQVKPMVEQGVAQAGPVLRRTAKRCGFGCFAAVYVMFMLGALLVPALFLNLWFARGFIEEPLEFREVLRFDYRQVL